MLKFRLEIRCGYLLPHEVEKKLAEFLASYLASVL